MNLMARQDRVLLGGLAVALIVVFSPPIRSLLDMAQDAGKRSGLALMSDAISAGGHLCMPMTAGGHPVGVLGVPVSAGPFTPPRTRVLAISIRNAQRTGASRRELRRLGRAARRDCPKYTTKPERSALSP